MRTCGDKLTCNVRLRNARITCILRIHDTVDKLQEFGTIMFNKTVLVSLVINMLLCHIHQILIENRNHTVHKHNLQVATKIRCLLPFKVLQFKWHLRGS